MADSTITDVNKMKVVDLRKELKSRGLVSTGDKAELVTRLQAALAQDDPEGQEQGLLDDTDDDSDGVLDEDDKSHPDLWDDTAAETLSEDLVLADNPPLDTIETSKPEPEVKPSRTLKRKITTDSSKNKTSDTQAGENKESQAKKIVLNRATSLTTVTTPPAEAPQSEKSKGDKMEITAPIIEESKVKLSDDSNAKSKLELRAQRFGLPVKMTDVDKKEARKQRFNQTGSDQISKSISPISTDENIEKLKKRAERFGQSVSKFMTDIENKEKLEKRKAKFGTAN